MPQADGDAPDMVLAEMRSGVDNERDEKKASTAPYLAARDATARVERLEKREAQLLELAAEKGE